MKKLIIVSAALCVALIAAGCSGTKNAPASEPVVIATVPTAVSESTVEETTAPAHQVTVEDLTNVTLSDGVTDYNSSIPKLIVDGQEATEINNSISNYIQETYPLEKTDDGVDGYETRYSWGVMDNTVSIVINASAVCEDYFTCEVFNYDLDTLQPLSDSEVVSRFGMTDDEFFSKTAEVYMSYFGNIPDYDINKSIAAINYDKITPMITSNGNPGVAGCVIYAADSQFGGMESIRCFDIVTMERV